MGLAVQESNAFSGSQVSPGGGKGDATHIFLQRSVGALSRDFAGGLRGHWG